MKEDPFEYNMTGPQMVEMIGLDPDWFAHPTRKVVITTFADCRGTNLNGLGPNIVFIGTNEAGECADFQDCDDLGDVAATFHGSVEFINSGVSDISQMKILAANHAGEAAIFTGCTGLKLATGKFPGFVDFTSSGVEEIRDLIIEPTTKPPDFVAADFNGCKALKVATGTYPGKVCFPWSGIMEIRDLVVNGKDHNGVAADLRNCHQLKTASGTFAGAALFDGSTIEKVENLHAERNTHHIAVSLTKTPLANANPRLAAELLTQSKNPADWKKTMEYLAGQEKKSPIAVARMDILKRACGLEKLKGKPTIEL